MTAFTRYFCNATCPQRWPWSVPLHHLQGQTANALLRSRCTLIPTLSKYFNNPGAIIRSLGVSRGFITGFIIVRLVNGEIKTDETPYRLTISFADSSVRRETPTSDTAICKALQSEGYLPTGQRHCAFSDTRYHHLHQASSDDCEFSIDLDRYGSNASILKRIVELSQSSVWVFATSEALCTLNLKFTEGGVDWIRPLNLVNRIPTLISLHTADEKQIDLLKFRRRFLGDSASLLVETPHTATGSFLGFLSSFSWIEDGYASYAIDDDDYSRDDRVLATRFEEHKEWLGLCEEISIRWSRCRMRRSWRLEFTKVSALCSIDGDVRHTTMWTYKVTSHWHSVNHFPLPSLLYPISLSAAAKGIHSSTQGVDGFNTDNTISGQSLGSPQSNR